MLWGVFKLKSQAGKSTWHHEKRGGHQDSGNIRRSAGELGLGTQRTVQQGNHPKHTAEGVETRLAKNNISVLESRPESDSEFVERTEDQWKCAKNLSPFLKTVKKKEISHSLMRMGLNDFGHGTFYKMTIADMFHSLPNVLTSFATFFVSFH